MGLDEHESHSLSNSSLSRAFSSVTGPFTRRRRLSSFSSASTAPRRRGSIQSFIDSWPSSKHSMEQQRAPLQHQDSGMNASQSTSSPYSNSTAPRPFSLKRFGSLRRRHSPVGTFPGDMFSPPAPAVGPSPPLPGTAARQAAAAANQDRQNQLRREQEHEHTTRFLHGLIPPSIRPDDIKDNESGVDMTCESPIVRTNSLTDKKMSMFSHLVTTSVPVY